jgi:threonine dehydrogenase-like Zn-dependent dehydrogenase
MRGTVFMGGRELQLMQFDDPTPGPHEVVVAIKASGMCGSDPHQYRRPKGGAMPSARSTCRPTRPTPRMPRGLRMASRCRGR